MAFFYRGASSPVPPLSPSPSASAASSSSLDEPPPQRRRKNLSNRNAASSSARKGARAGAGAPTIGVSPAVIPDMRFEQSYLASVRGFIHELEPAQAKREKKEAIAASRRKHRAREAAEGEGVGSGEKEHGGSSEEEEVAEEEGERWIEARNPKGESELWIGRLRIDW